MPYTAPTVEADVFKPQDVGYNGYLANIAQRTDPRGILAGAALRNRAGQAGGNPQAYAALMEKIAANNLEGNLNDQKYGIAKEVISTDAARRALGAGGAYTIAPEVANTYGLQFNQGQSNESDALAADSINATTFKNKVAGNAQLATDLGLKAPNPYLGNQLTAANDPNPMPLEPYMTPANKVAQQEANAKTLGAQASMVSARKSPSSGGGDDNSGTFKYPNNVKVMRNNKTGAEFYVVPPKKYGDKEKWVNVRTNQIYDRPANIMQYSEK